MRIVQHLRFEVKGKIEVQDIRIKARGPGREARKSKTFWTLIKAN
jgi:hypothetical protein